MLSREGLKANERADALESLASLIPVYASEFARLEALSMGIPISTYGFSIGIAVDVLKCEPTPWDAF